MKPISSALLALAVFAVIAGPAQAGFDFTTFDVPSAVFTLGMGINNAGQIVGNFVEPNTPAYQTYGFLLSGGTYSRLDRAATANAINNAGDIVGADHVNAGYLYRGGVYTTIGVPGARSTVALGINDLGQIVGSSALGGFLYSGGM